MGEATNKRFQTNEKAKVEQYGRGDHASAQVLNISQGGAFLEWIDDGLNLKAGDLIRLTITLRKLGKIRSVNAVVKWIKTDKGDNRINGVGVGFIKPDQVLNHLMSRM